MATATQTAGRTEPEPPALGRARRVAHLLDESIRVPVIGYRVGLDPLLGVLPVAGDTVAAVGSLYVVLVGVRLGLPARAVVKMLSLVALDWALGSVPVLGTIVDAVLKANERNVATIESHLTATTDAGAQG